MSAWSRTILVPLSLLWAFKPAFELPPDQQIPELFLNTPAELPVTMPKSDVVASIKGKSWMDWHAVFAALDRLLKLGESLRLLPFRRRAVQLAAQWMQDRFNRSDGLGAIFPPIIWSVIALKCLGHSDDSPDVLRALNELEKLSIHEDNATRLEPCKSPVWDTAIATISLREAGTPAEDPSIRNAVQWLLSKEVRTPGDWCQRRPGAEPAGWYFEFNNEFYPDVDDTCMVTMALVRSLPWHAQRQWRAESLSGDAAGTAKSDALGLVMSWSDGLDPDALATLEDVQPMLQAIARGARWISGMQNSDGGWGAFDRDNTREIYTQVPFADHNAMIDPSTADLTGRMLEMYAGLGMAPSHPVAQKALDFLWREQEADHCWFGRWGVNYVYGTWQVLVGLRAIGIPIDDPRVRRAASWLKTMQQDCGGWGESCESYDHPHLRGQGRPTASQTAWALMGLIAAGEADSPAVDAGVQYLLDMQRDDGTWDEEPFTGTGFPRVFYLKYHLYRIYFPLMALARVARTRHGDWVLAESRAWM
jgi:squalene-hopene/tetraprenyl-beta-curcumene cyclase